MSQNKDTKQAARDAADKVAEDGRDLAGDMRDHAEAIAQTKKDEVADRVGGFAETLRGTSDDLRDRDEDTVAGLADTAADQIDRVSRALRQKDVGAMFQEANDLARAHPALFLGGAVALGFMAGRFIRASAPQDDAISGYENPDHGTRYDLATPVPPAPAGGPADVRTNTDMGRPNGPKV